MQWSSIDYNKIGAQFERIIYYDSLPVKKKNQNNDEFKKEFDEKQDFLNQIRLQPKYHVRDGYTRMRPRATGGIEQKGVDTWLAIEVMQFAFKNTIDIAEIITGDLDLYPLFEALVQTNTTGVLHYQKGNTSQELIMSADVAHPITTKTLIQWSKNQFHQEYIPDQHKKIIDLSVKPFTDTYQTNHGECSVRYKNGIWQANFTPVGNVTIGNVLTTKSRLLLIDEINSFTKSFSVPDAAFLEK